VGHLAAPAGQIGAAVAERAAALVAAAAIAGAGGFVLDRSEGRDRALPGGIVPPAAQTQPDPVAPTSGPSATEQPALRLPGLALFGPPFPQPAERAPVERPGAKSSSNRDSASGEQQQSSGRLARQLGRPVRGVLGDSSRLPSLGKLTAPLRPGNKGLIPGREPAPAVPQDPGSIGASVSPDRRPLARVASAVRTLTLAATGGAAEAVSAEE
jgi:hypothetical protein